MQPGGDALTVQRSGKQIALSERATDRDQCVAIAGGILALVIALRRGRLGRTMGLTARLLGRPDKLKTTIESPAEHNRFSYGPAIAIGCVIAMLIGDSL